MTVYSMHKLHSENNDNAARVLVLWSLEALFLNLCCYGLIVGRVISSFWHVYEIGSSISSNWVNWCCRGVHLQLVEDFLGKLFILGSYLPHRLNHFFGIMTDCSTLFTSSSLLLILSEQIGWLFQHNLETKGGILVDFWRHCTFLMGLHLLLRLVFALQLFTVMEHSSSSCRSN